VKDNLRVGSWLVAPSLNSISCQDRNVRLEPKVMGVLLCLAQHPGETLSKERLFQAVWPNVVVTDDVLKRCIAELRRAFKDDVRQPRFIETVSKRGYRLIAQVRVPAAATPRDESVARDSLVVLPFINMSADPESEYFADGITEEIIDALAQIRELHLVARSSSFSLKGRHIDVRSIGEQLNVRTVLEGSVRRADSRLRITAKLVKAADGYHLWSEHYDREMKDVFAIQEDIARRIAQRLKVTFPWSSGEPLVKAATPNLDAYDSYLKARALLYKRGVSIRPALGYYERAVKLDPNYALAWAGLADCYATLGIFGLTPPQQSMPKAIEAARRAVALDSLLAEGHNALAMASLMGAWDRAEAEREFARAMELNPKCTQAFDWYGLFCVQLSKGQLAEGMEQAKVALLSDPVSAYAHAIYALTCLVAGKIAEGEEASRRAIELDPESFIAQFSLQELLRVSGQFEESVATAEFALAMSGRHAWSMTVLALTLADWGKAMDADSVYCEMQARARREYMPPAPLAVAASAAAREDEAIGHARKAYEIRDPDCQIFLTEYSWLSGYPWFRELVRHVAWARGPTQ
jgi:TolB-like protein/Tfp pilus assembly protein PilF